MSSNMETVDSFLEKAKDFRLQGNHLFRNQSEFSAASMLYSQALETLKAVADGACAGEHNPAIRDELILNYCNRSACLYIQNDLERAKSDAEKAWTLSSKTSLKAAYRLAKALVALQQYTQAKELIQYIMSPELSEQLTEDEKKSFQDLWNQVLAVSFVPEEEETSIKFVKRPISIREFTVQEALGYGNFSEIHVVVHKKTLEKFALKKIPKKQAADLAKRQHPNVYNEIQMERRVLLERLPPTSAFVIHMYHAFQDYENLYYLMELHDQWTDLWTQLRWKQKMVGCHRQQAKIWLYQLVLALEHLHSHGIVHRDIKAENILLNRHGHLVLIDLGTAKDLIETDLNGPEFVGTPDFMSPEAVTGDASTKLGKDPKTEEKGTPKLGKATANADLWALGALGYILQTGMTPFWTTSPYLAFLRIQRGLLTRPVGIIEDDCWNWIQSLMHVQPHQRLGADTYVASDITKKVTKKYVSNIGGYKDIKEHAYLAWVHQQYTTSPAFRRQTPIPSLCDLCYRAVADQAYKDCLDIDLCEAHPPGDGSSHDLMRLSQADRRAVLHLLDRQQLLRQEPGLWSRFFTSNIDARLTQKIRPDSRDVVGLTQMNDDQGKAPGTTGEGQFQANDKKTLLKEMLEFVQLCSPLLTRTADKTNEDNEEYKTQKKLFRKCIAHINKVRPKLVIVSASVVVDQACQKLLARINESIPVVFHQPNPEGNDPFCTFWFSGIQGLMVSHRLANQLLDESSSPSSSSTSSTTETTRNRAKEQMDWIREQADLCRVSKHPLFCFVNGPVHEGFPALVIKKLARGRTLALFGPSAGFKRTDSSTTATTTKNNNNKKPKFWGIPCKYHANEKVSKKAVWRIPPNNVTTRNVDNDDKNASSDDDDNISVKSSDSVEDHGDEFTTIVESTSSAETGLRWIRVDPVNADEWSYDMEWVVEEEED